MTSGRRCGIVERRSRRQSKNVVLAKTKLIPDRDGIIMRAIAELAAQLYMCAVFFNNQQSQRR
ncbi:MAG: hypothetical protein M3P08_14690 [Thermoproteota archaeon]|nr:hypothetical protein [Thermoproteota archaeon]